MSEPVVLWGVGTARTLRAHWALQEMGVPYETRGIQSRSGETQTEEFRRLNPREKIPVLQVGDLTLAESGAIVNFVAERFGKPGELAPLSGTVERALYDQWCAFALMELDATTLYVLRRHEDLASIYGKAPEAVASSKAYFQKQAAVAEQHLAGGRPYLVGDRFTGADLILTTCLDWAAFYGLELSDGLAAYRERQHERESHGRAFAENFPPEVMAALMAARAQGAKT